MVQKIMLHDPSEPEAVMADSEIGHLIPIVLSGSQPGPIGVYSVLLQFLVRVHGLRFA